MIEINKTPKEILDFIYKKASEKLGESVIADINTRDNIYYICHCISNRAGIRLLMSCMLAKMHNPKIDPRKPYTEIKEDNTFSGRYYDEKYLTKFINDFNLPVNLTTAFLTLTLRNINTPLTIDRDLVGRPRELYKRTLQVLNEVAENRILAETVFIECVRTLIQIKNEKLTRMTSLLNSLKFNKGALPLSSEEIVTLIGQHLNCKNSSRLPVLIVTAAYETVGLLLGESLLSLNSHNAADSQTGSIGDLEICLLGDNAVATVYEMKMRRVTIEDIDTAITKITKLEKPINNYLFITTEKVEFNVMEYAAKLYEKTSGTEIAILDCMSFLRHFLHLFHRIRTEFLNAYQNLVLNEPDSAVSQPLKEVFLALRQAAESGD